MFSGIIKHLGTVVDTYREGTNKIFWIKSELTPDLHIDQSISHNGTCLTIEEVKDDTYRVTAIAETLTKTNLGSWNTGSIINLEKSITLQTLLDGHIVQGHVDTTAKCMEIKSVEGSHIFTFQLDSSYRDLIIEKGSIAVNGISLTVFDCIHNNFRVAIIPYTYSHTNFNTIEKGDTANIEFDVIGKYVKRIMGNHQD